MARTETQSGNLPEYKLPYELLRKGIDLSSLGRHFSASDNSLAFFQVEDRQVLGVQHGKYPFEDAPGVTFHWMKESTQRGRRIVSGVEVSIDLAGTIRARPDIYRGTMKGKMQQLMRMEMRLNRVTTRIEPYKGFREIILEAMRDRPLTLNTQLENMALEIDKLFIRRTPNEILLARLKNILRDPNLPSRNITPQLTSLPRPQHLREVQDA